MILITNHQFCTMLVEGRVFQGSSWNDLAVWLCYLIFKQDRGEIPQQLQMLRKILSIKGLDKIRNEDLYRELPLISKVIQTRHLQIAGHVFRDKITLPQIRSTFDVISLKCILDCIIVYIICNSFFDTNF